MTDPGRRQEVRHITCTLCEAMCGLEVRLDGEGSITSMRGHEADPLSRGHICPKAFALQDVHEDPDRLRRPVRRTADGGWREVSWDDAISFAASAAGRGAARARRRRRGRLPGQPQRPQPRRADPQPHPRAAAAHAKPVLRHLGRPAAAPGRRLGALRAPVPAAGARHRPHRPARARRPQPDGLERVAVDGARLPAAPPRARGSRRPARRHRPAPHRDGQGRRRAPLRPARAPTPPCCWRSCASCWRRRGRSAGPAAYVDGVDAVRAAVRAVHARARRAGERHARGCRARPRAGTSPPRRRPPSTGGWVCRPRPTVWSASGRSRRSTCSPATSTARAGRCSRRRRSTSWGGACSGRAASARAGPGCAACRGSGASCPSRRSRRRSRTPGEGQVRALLTIAGNPVSSTPGGHRLDEALGGPRRHGGDRLLRQRDDPARRRHPAADRAARARPLRPRLPPPRRARHGPLVAGALPRPSRGPARLGDRPRPRRRAAARARRRACGTGGRGPRCRPRRGCG